MQLSNSAVGQSRAWRALPHTVELSSHRLVGQLHNVGTLPRSVQLSNPAVGRVGRTGRTITDGLLERGLCQHPRVDV